MAGPLSLLVLSSVLLSTGTALRTPHRRRNPPPPTFPPRFTTTPPQYWTTSPGVTRPSPNPYVFTTLSAVSPVYEVTLPAGYSAPPNVTEAVSNRGPSAYQPNALPLGQTGSPVWLPVQFGVF